MTHYYLDPNFEPKKLTKAELRSIMASHGVLNLPPPTAKKAELLDLFYKEIIANRDVIMERQRSVKPTSDGIIFLDESSTPSPKKPKSPKKALETVAKGQVSTPAKSRILNVDRPQTPPTVATYKLVSRMEKLEEKGGQNSRLQSSLMSPSLLKCLFISVPILLLACPYVYLRFWHQWPVYTVEQFDGLENKPALHLSCPYPSVSPIGGCLDGKLYCSNGYIKTHYWFWFGSYCAIDKERLSLIESMKKKIVMELESRAGLNMCYGGVPADLNKTELALIIERPFKFLKPKTFVDYFDICIKSLLLEGSKIVSNDGETIKAKTAYFSFYCRIKLFLLRLLAERPLEIFLSIMIIFTVSSLSLKYELQRRRNQVVFYYYSMICKILKDQSSQHRSDPTVPSYIAINQLRDAIFVKFSSSKRTQIWPKILAEINRNSNIVESITICRGEQTRVWEWIGAELGI